MSESAQEVKSGTCRVCGCTEFRGCEMPHYILDEYPAVCWWVDAAHTLCSNPHCIAVVPLAELERLAA
jgi:hypothetical protein